MTVGSSPSQTAVRFFAVWLLVLATVLVSGCNGGTTSIPTVTTDPQPQGQAEPDTGLGSPPSPSSPTRGASVLPDQFTGLCRYREADDFLIAGYGNLTYWVPEFEVLTMSTSYTSDSGLAYVIYTFSPADMPGSWDVHLEWKDDPEPGSGWIGLANFTKNRWDWFSIDGPVTVPEPHSDYLGEEDELCIIVALTEHYSYLRGVWLGDNQPPVADLNPEWSFTAGITEITLDASGSYDPEGGDLTYYWDIDNDGTIDETTDVPELQVSYPGGEITTSAVWLSDGTGAYNRATAWISIADPPEPDWLNLDITLEGICSYGHCLVAYRDLPLVINHEVGAGSQTTMLVADGRDCLKWNRRVTFETGTRKSDDDPIPLVIGDQLALVSREYGPGVDQEQLLFRFGDPEDPAFWEQADPLVVKDYDVHDRPRCVDMELIDGRLTVIFSVGSNLYYLVADDAAGTNWSDAVLLDNYYIPRNNTGEVLVDAGGFPAISYLQYGEGTNNQSIVYRRALDINGDEWADINLLSNGNRIYSNALLVMVQDKPMVIFSYMNEEETDRYLCLFRAADELGDTWNEMETVPDLDGGYSMDAAFIGDRLVLTWGSTAGGSTKHLFCAEATDATATDWEVMDVAILYGFEATHYPAITVIQDTPIIAVNRVDLLSQSSTISVYTPYSP